VLLGVDDPLSATLFRKTLISAVARAMQPGCKVDTILVLKGVQGTGKSTLWKALMHTARMGHRHHAEGIEGFPAAAAPLLGV